MRFFPKIKKPCPYQGDRADIMVGDVCRLCNKRVYDLTDMSEPEKEALLADCDELCVSYKIDRKLLAASVAVGAGILVPAAVVLSDSAEHGAPHQSEVPLENADEIKYEFGFGGI